jgi:hypothetical protein
MRICTNLFRLVCAALALCLPLAAQNISRVNCPGIVSLATPQLAKPIPGWSVVLDTAPHRLSRVTFFEGPLQENASLVPDKQTSLGKTKTAIWTLQPKPEHPYFLACYYSGTSLGLSRPMPPGLKECKISYNTSVEIDGMPVITSLLCN